jgi:hypothetical protein
MPKSYAYKFAIGDIVTKRFGKKPATVIAQPSQNPTSSSSWGWESEYLLKYQHSGLSFRALQKDLKLYEPSDSSTMTNAKTLYSFTKADGTVGYGSYLATNSSNQFVIEEKGTGAILTFDKDQLEEVLPYTYAVKFGNNEVHYVGKPGCVKKGDIVLSNSGDSNFAVGRVVAVDTKSKGAEAKFAGVKLITAPIEG